MWSRWRCEHLGESWVVGVSLGPESQARGELVSQDIVNLGFVINVIEDREERADALLKAYALSKKLLVVSAMIASEPTF